MDLRRNIWLWVVLGMIFFSLVISLVFLLINKCISKKASEHNNRYKPNQTTPAVYAQSNKYHPKDPDGDLPPLPPRTQFLPSCPDKSYENIAELPDYIKIDDKVPPPPYHFTETPANQTVCCNRDSITETPANQNVCRNRDSISEDYDDIGADCPSEDYDDVG